MDFIRSHPAGRALDLGCGTGTNAITLAHHGWQVTGIDFVAKVIRSARRKAQKAGVEVNFRQGDVTRLDDLPGGFDLILDIGCFHSLPSGGKALYATNLERLLSPDGTFLMYAFFRSAEETFSGLTPGDLDILGNHLTLVSRIDGTERGSRSSSWFTYHRQQTD